MLAMTQLVGFGAGAENDPFFSSVKLLLHGDGADASTTFIDSSSNARSPSVAGNTQIDTAQFVFGNASILFDGSGDNLSYASNADWSFSGTDDFTIEMWVRWNNLTGSQFLMQVGSGISLAGAAYGGGKVWFGKNGTADYVSSTTIPTTGAWYHVAVSRGSGSLRLFINGTQEGGTIANSGVSYSQNTLFIGSTLTPNNYFNGWIDDVRITKGAARYTASFTPTNSPFPDF